MRVLLFASLREKAGAAELTLELTSDATVAAARSALLDRLPILNGRLDRIAWAVNRSYANLEMALHENDELALLPPVSGG
ncbi:MAG TPA: molybdopterin converting factor subunit 1 [Tepidisphaeraceae bacterium]|nr:molybdopterin converting factor subunit 1 [Tepidisphaeraceae bacterium]